MFTECNNHIWSMYVSCIIFIAEDMSQQYLAVFKSLWNYNTLARGKSNIWWRLNILRGFRELNVNPICNSHVLQLCLLRSTKYQISEIPVEGDIINDSNGVENLLHKYLLNALIYYSIFFTYVGNWRNNVFHYST